MKNKLLFLALLFAPAVLMAAPSSNRPPLEIREADGSPKCTPRRLDVTNGTLTCNPNGVAELTTGGGGGGSGDVILSSTQTFTGQNMFTNVLPSTFTRLDVGRPGVNGDFRVYAHVLDDMIKIAPSNNTQTIMARNSTDSSYGLMPFDAISYLFRFSGDSSAFARYQLHESTNVVAQYNTSRTQLYAFEFFTNPASSLSGGIWSQDSTSSGAGRNATAITGFATGAGANSRRATGVTGRAESTSDTNVGLYGSASGGTSNYGLLIDAGQAVFRDSATVLGSGGMSVLYSITAGSIATNGSGAGSINLVKGSSLTITGVGSTSITLWADTETGGLAINVNGLSTSTVVVNPDVRTYTNMYGGYFSTFTVLGSTTTALNRLYDYTQAHFAMPVRTVAQVGAATPMTNGWGNIIKLSNPGGTVNVCVSTGTARGAWGLITATTSACL